MRIPVSKYQFLFALLWSLIIPYLQNTIYSIIDGNLSNDWIFNLHIFVQEFNGVILYCIDNTGNQFGIVASRGNDGDYIRISFNYSHRVANIKHLCGCDSCENTIAHFNIRSTNSVISVTCNQMKTEYLKIGSKYVNTEVVKGITYPIPSVIVSRSDSIYIMIGNIGPYDNSDSRYAGPLKIDLVACLVAFHHNYARVHFESTAGSNMRTTCGQTCANNSCNGGVCIQMIDGIVCDCSMADLNGRYCNNSLRLYTPGTHNCYEKIKGATDAHFKMTWRGLLDKEYCLVDIVAGKNHVTLSARQNKLIYNLATIGDILEDGINFVNVNISNNYFTIKTPNVVRTIDFLMYEDVQINVGFTNYEMPCDTFEGGYDFYFNLSLRKVSRLASSSSDLYYTRRATGMVPLPTKGLYTTGRSADGGNGYKGLLNIVYPIFVCICGITGYVVYKRVCRYLHTENKNGTDPPIELTVDVNSTKDNAIPNYYSLLDYAAIDSSAMSGDSDGYMVANELPPELPSRPLVVQTDKT